MASMVDLEGIRQAYDEVRDDSNSTNWCCLRYNDKDLELDGTGEEFEDLVAKFTEDERMFAYLRVQTGDEMSKRMKFGFITWIGPSVSALKKAKVSTDKASVKNVFQIFATEFLFDDLHDVKLDKIKETMIKAGGANYGTGR